MNNSFVRLVDGMCATLRQEVLPRLEDEFARGQVFGIINLLNTLRLRADWSAGFLSEQIAAQRTALAGVRAATAELADALRPCVPEEQAPPATTTASELLRLRDDNNRAIGSLLRWLDERRTELPSGVAVQTEGLLRTALQAEVDLELRHAPRPLFAEMSSGRED